MPRPRYHGYTLAKPMDIQPERITLLKRLFDWTYRASLDPVDLESRRRALLIHAFAAIGFVASAGYAVASVARADWRMASILCLVAIFSLVSVPIFRITKNPLLISGSAIIMLSSILLFILATGGTGNTGLIWTFVFPPMAIYSLGHRWGTLISMLFIGAATVVVFALGDWFQVPYSAELQNRWLSALVFVAVITALTERSRHRSFVLLKAENQVRQETEQQLRRAKDLAEQATQAKGEFLANMSHELRTPLTSLIGMNSLLMTTHLDQEQIKYVSAMKMSGEHLVTVINDVLDLSKMEAGRVTMEEIGFRPLHLAAEVLESFRPATSAKGLALELSLAGEIPEGLLGDPARLRQVLNNLIGNAVKFTERGRIHLLLEARLLAHEECQLRWSVTDTGIGVPPSLYGAIFEAFQQADGSTTRLFGGTGLGLAISKKLVEAMGGRIDLFSEEGKGSTFWFQLVLPRTHALNESGMTPDMETVCGQENRSARLLIVEDDANNRALIALMAQRFGCEVDTAVDGTQAIEKVSESEYDLIFMDCQMPKLDGFQATEAIRKLEAASDRRRVPIIAVSANVTEHNRERCQSCGMDDFMMKPYEVGTMEKTLRQWLPESAS